MYTLTTDKHSYNTIYEFNGLLTIWYKGICCFINIDLELFSVMFPKQKPVHPELRNSVKKYFFHQYFTIISFFLLLCF